MPEYKNYDQGESLRNLKSADAEKSFGSSATPQVESLSAKMNELTKPSRFSARRRLPVIVDIIIGILMLAIAAGIIVGAVFLFQYYTDDYESIELTYTFISPCEEDLQSYRTMRNKELYREENGNTLYFGKVTSVEVLKEGSPDGSNLLVVEVEANVKYKKGEGYSVGDCRIAVGSEYTLRSEYRLITGTIVELAELSRLEAPAAFSSEKSSHETENKEVTDGGTN